jgi:hypothetical protein
VIGGKYYQSTLYESRIMKPIKVVKERGKRD